MEQVGLDWELRELEVIAGHDVILAVLPGVSGRSDLVKY